MLLNKNCRRLTEKINLFVSSEYIVIGVAPAGARVPLRGPMTRGDYGELSMIRSNYFNSVYYDY